MLILDLVEVKINDVLYYCPADRVDDIVQVGNTLTLSTSGSITLYSSLAHYSSNDGYPRITLSFGNTGRYITRSGSSYTTTTDLEVNSFEITKNENTLYAPLVNTLLLIVIGVACICRLFKN